jgi:hypothetical protein
MKIGSNTSKKKENHPTLVFRNLHNKKLISQGVNHGKTLISNPFQENQEEEDVGCESLIDPRILK